MSRSRSVVAGLIACWVLLPGVLAGASSGPAPAVVARPAAPLAPAAAAVSAPSPGSVSGGGAHLCVRTGAGGAKCWGYNLTGGLGDGTTTGRVRPVDVSGLTSGLASIDAGGQTTCAVTTAGGAKCWGWNGDGQVGDGSYNDQVTPVDVAGLTSGVAAVSVGYFHACALTTAGGVKCWGDNTYGQLGDGTSAGRGTPADVVGLTSGVQAIATGLGDRDHTCALMTAGGVKCWGANDFGQLGDGTTTNRSTPVAVSGLGSGVSAIYAGGMHTCAVTTAGGAKCWGDNDGGQLGDGTTTTRLTPVDVVGLGGGVTDMALSQSSFGYGPGRSHTCAVAGGAVKCWGRNTEGEVGDGTADNVRLTPTDVVGLGSGYVAVGTSFWTGCAARTDGAVRCWGFSDTGDGTSLQRLTPVDVSGSFYRPECPTLIPAHLTFSLSDGYAVGSIATFTADPGFAIVGAATISCQADATWDGPLPTTRSSGVVAVDPATDLHGGDVVTVHLSGFRPGAALGWAQCIALALDPREGNCSGPFGGGTADATGSLDTSLRLARFVYIPNAGRWVDCADPAESCVVGAGAVSDLAGTATIATLTFAAPPPPPAVRGSISLAPPDVLVVGDHVTVTGSGFRPDAYVEVFQCAAGPTDPSGCNRSVATATTDAAGGFVADVAVVGSVTPPGGSPTACFAAPGACVLAAAEAVDFPGTVATATVSLLPTVVAGNATVTEGDTGTQTLELPVRLSVPSAQAVTVRWSTVFSPDWTAVAARPGVDYEAASGVLSFAPGETQQTVAVTVLGDRAVELDELLVVAFTEATNARVGGFYGLGLGRIANDDVLPTVVPGSASVVEGDAGTQVLAIPVHLSAPSDTTVTVEWSSVFSPDWTAVAAQPGVDYEAASGVVTFAPGETDATVQIMVDGDAAAELDELVVLAFANATDARIGGFFGLGFGSIVDDD